MSISMPRQDARRRRRLLATGTVLAVSLSALSSIPFIAGCGSSARERISAPIATTARDVTIGGQLQMTTTVSGTTATDVVWTVLSGGGSFSDAVPGLFLAPDTAGTVTVQAALRSDPSKSNTAFITVRPRIALGAAVVGTFPGLSTNLAATLQGATGALQWSVDGGAANGTLAEVQAASARYVAPLTPGNYTVRVATSDGAVVSTIALVVQPRTGAAVVVSPQQVSALTGDTVQLTAAVPDATNGAVTWTTSGGLVTPEGRFLSDVPGTFTVTATSVENPALSGTATITVAARPVAPAVLSVSPNPAGDVTVGGGLAFSATLPVTWSVTGGGSISASGFYTAPTTVPGGPVVVTATSSDPGVAPVHVSINVVPGTPPPPPATLTVFPNPVPSVVTDGTLPFSATLPVTWSVAGGGSISASGLFQAPSTVPGSGSVTVTATPTDTSIAPVSATVTITAPAPGTFAVLPNPVSPLTVEDTLQFVASRTVRWSIVESGTGATIGESDGRFTAPATVPATPNNEVTVKAEATDGNFVPVLVKVKILPRGSGGGTIGVN